MGGTLRAPPPGPADRINPLRSHPTAPEPGEGKPHRQVLGGFNEHDLDAIMAHFAGDCVFDSPRGPDRCGRRLAGKDEARRGLAARFEGIP